MISGPPRGVSRSIMLTHAISDKTRSEFGEQVCREAGLSGRSIPVVKEKINTAYSYLGIIKRNFIYLDEDAFVMLYKSLVRSHLEYANSVWNPHRLD